MLAHVYAASLSGIEAGLVRVEVDVLSRGLPGFSMVGLLETAVMEARDRVGSAIRNAGFAIPNRKTVVNLSPADMKKSGAHYDLAIAVALMAASGVCRPASSLRFLFAGELSLTGRVVPVSGALIMALAAKRRRLDGVVVPAANAWEATLAGAGEVIAVETLADVVAFINDGVVPRMPAAAATEEPGAPGLDLSEVRGQPFARRGLEIAAAGAHNIALKGPPGTGKTMLAERLPTILPPLTEEEAIEVAKIRSWHGLLREAAGLPSERPFRAPHHSASYAGIIGGGTAGNARLGEISLAHNGVLFLDELGEFRRDVIEVLRGPLESGVVNVVRAGVSLAYPARFQLACAFNLCPCGMWGHPTRPCTCGIAQVRKYRAKLSGPLLDRIDLHIDVGPPPHDALLEEFVEESSEAVRERVLSARERQSARNAHSRCNAHMPTRELGKRCRLTRDERMFLTQAAAHHHLSARAIHRVLKVSRTIADLAGSEEIRSEHIAEALQFRPQMDDAG